MSATRLGGSGSGAGRGRGVSVAQRELRAALAQRFTRLATMSLPDGRCEAPGTYWWDLLGTVVRYSQSYS